MGEGYGRAHVVDNYGDTKAMVRGLKDMFEESGFTTSLEELSEVYMRSILLKTYQKAGEKCYW